MPDADLDFIPLPSDPRLLTRELALKCCTHPEVLVQEFARLAYTNHSTTTPTPSGESEAKSA